MYFDSYIYCSLGILTDVRWVQPVGFDRSLRKVNPLISTGWVRGVEPTCRFQRERGQSNQAGWCGHKNCTVSTRCGGWLIRRFRQVGWRLHTQPIDFNGLVSESTRRFRQVVCQHNMSKSTGCGCWRLSSSALAAHRHRCFTGFQEAIGICRSRTLV